MLSDVLSDVFNILFSMFENNSLFLIIFLFPVILFLFTSICKFILNSYSCVSLSSSRSSSRVSLSSSRSSSRSSDLPEDADAYVLDSSGVLVPVYSFDRGD